MASPAVSALVFCFQLCSFFYPSDNLLRVDGCPGSKAEKTASWYGCALKEINERKVPYPSEPEPESGPYAGGYQRILPVAAAMAITQVYDSLNLYVADT